MIDDSNNEPNDMDRLRPAGEAGFAVGGLMDKLRDLDEVLHENGPPEYAPLRCIQTAAWMGWKNHPVEGAGLDREEAEKKWPSGEFPENWREKTHVFLLELSEDEADSSAVAAIALDLLRVACCMSGTARRLDFIEGSVQDVLGELRSGELNPLYHIKDDSRL